MAEKNLDFYDDFRIMQRSLPLIEKKTEAFKYKYAPLEEILEKWNPVFDEHGFVLMQSTTAGSDGVSDIVCTKLHHSATGMAVESSLTIPVSDDYQKVGSGVTYYRRYTLLTVCGQQPVGEDFDGLKDRVSKPKAAKKKSPKEDETGVHIAYEAFAQGAGSVDALNDFYRDNKDAISKLPNEKQKQIISVFSERKIEIQKGK